jgi:hypothetical protein
MSIIFTNQGVAYITGGTDAPFITKNVNKYLPIKVNKIQASSVSLSLLQNLIKIDPQLGALFQRNPILLGLLDASQSQSERGQLVANFIRENSLLSDSTKNKLISLVEDLKFNQVLRKPGVLDRNSSAVLEEIQNILGNDVYNRLVDANLVTDNVTSLVLNTLSPYEVGQLKAKGVGPERVAQLLSKIIVTSEPDTINRTVKSLFDSLPVLPVAPEIIGNPPDVEVNPGPATYNLAPDNKEEQQAANTALAVHQKAAAGPDETSVVPDETSVVPEVSARGTYGVLTPPGPGSETDTSGIETSVVPGPTGRDTDTSGEENKKGRAVLEPSEPLTVILHLGRFLQLGRSLRNVNTSAEAARFTRSLKPVEIEKFVNEYDASKASIPNLIENMKKSAKELANIDFTLENAKLENTQVDKLNRVFSLYVNLGSDVFEELTKRGIDPTAVIPRIILPDESSGAGLRFKKTGYKFRDEWCPEELKTWVGKMKTDAGKRLMNEIYAIETFPKGVKNLSLYRNITPLTMTKKVKNLVKDGEFKDFTLDVKEIRKYINENKAS